MLIMLSVGLAAIGVLMQLNRGRKLAMPGVLLAAVYPIVGAAGYIAYRYFHPPYIPSQAEVFYEPLRTSTLYSFFIAGVGVACGTMLCALVSYQAGSDRRLEPLARIQTTVGQLSAGSLMVASLLPAMLYVEGRGPSTLLSADYYLQYTGPQWAAKIGFALIPVGALVACVLARRSGATRLVGIAMVSIYILVLVAAATRALALVPLAWVAGGWLNSKSPKRRSLVIAAALTLVLVNVPVVLRSEPMQGLIPFWHVIIATPGYVLVPNWGRTINNLLFSVPLANFVETTPVGLHAIFVSVDPLPGGSAGWSQISESLRVNLFTPFSAIGEVFSESPLLGFIYFSVTGFLISYCWRSRPAQSGWAASVRSIVVLGVTVLFGAQSFEYNTRSVSRLIYYMLALTIATAIVGGKTRGVAKVAAKTQSESQWQHASEALSGVDRQWQQL